MTDTSTSVLQPLHPDVVSVQSQAVYGHVGNNVAVPTSESLGLSAAAVPTVMFSNTPHYPTMHGGALPIEWFEGYLQDLSAHGALHALRAILVGYLGTPGQAEVLARWTQTLQAERVDLRVVIDPVMGDHDHGIYAGAGRAEAYRQLLLPLAHGLTPNGFELGQLTGLPVDDIEGVIAAARTLLTGCTQWIAVTSAAPDTWTEGVMQVVLVTRAHVHLITHTRLAPTPKGTGDLFCAALTGHWLNGASLPEAVARACQTIVQALHRTESERCTELLLPTRVRPLETSHSTHALTPVLVRRISTESHWSHRSCNTLLPI